MAVVYGRMLGDGICAYGDPATEEIIAVRLGCRRERKS